MKNKICHILAILVLTVIVSENNMIVRAAESSEFSRYEDEISTIMEEKRSFYLNDQEFYLEADKANATIRLKDCNNNSAYYGQHIVSVNDAYKAVNEESSRCGIWLPVKMENRMSCQ